MTVDSLAAENVAVVLRGSETSFVTQSLILEGLTSITTAWTIGAHARTETGDITVSAGKGVTIDSAGAGIGALAAVQGNIVVTSYATIHAGKNVLFVDASTRAGGEGIAATGNGGGAVSVTNYGNVTSDYGRGIYADGGNGHTAAVEVSITNYGAVDAWHEGVRVIQYNGTATATNAAGASILSRNRQAMVSWADVGDAIGVNYGSMTAENGAGMVIWGQRNAIADNYGSVSAAYLSSRPSTGSSWYGIEAFSQTAGDVRLVNHAGATVVASYSDGLYGHGTSGSVSITNAGRVTAAGAGIKADTANGDITAINSGWIGADGADGAVVLKGRDGSSDTPPTTSFVGNASFTNRQGGIVAANSQLSKIPGLGNLSSLSDSERSQFVTAIERRAVALAVNATTLDVTNAGTILGNINISTDTEPTTGTGRIGNSGLWAFSGNSGFGTGVAGATVDNSGTIWALGTSSLAANLTNNGALWATSLNGAPARLTVSGNYTGGAGSSMYVDYASIAHGGAAIVSITGNATGSTNVVLSDPQSLSGIALANLPRNAVVTVTGTPANGASTFTMQQSYGLVTMGLDYSAATQTWSINYSTAKAGNMLDKVPQAGAKLVTSISDIGADRLDILRSEVLGGGGLVSSSYAAESADPISSALAKAPGRPKHGAWTSVIGNVGHGDGYNRESATLQAGLDGGMSLDNGDFVTLGVMAGYNATKFSFDDRYNMVFTGPSLASYGELTFKSGHFITADVAWQRLNASIDFAGVSSTSEGNSFGGKLTGGYRFMSRNFEITPSVSVGANHTKIGDFAMQGLAVQFGASNTLSGEAMLKIARPMVADFGWFTPFGSVKLGDRKTSGGGVSVSDAGTYTGASTGVFGAGTLGFTVSNAEGTSSARLSGTVRRDGRENSFELRAGASLLF
ncbi:DUF3575 domain-containing protein [Undibacter mobilis]|nr:DUF3575 domain-containing protein [Undibacter mobilis]